MSALRPTADLGARSTVQPLLTHSGRQDVVEIAVSLNFPNCLLRSLVEMLPGIPMMELKPAGLSYRNDNALELRATVRATPEIMRATV
jgi:hypothetical protein